MDLIDALVERNAHFAKTEFAPDLKMLPSKDVIVLGCVDPRVDPAAVLGLQLGEAAVVRNIGGRINPSFLQTMGVLKVVAQVAGRQGGVGNLVLLHHTDCGISGCYHQAPDLLAKYLGVEPAALDDMEIPDPRKAVVHDIAALAAASQLPDGLVVTGLVYDVTSGLVEVVSPPAPLRPKAD